MSQQASQQLDLRAETTSLPEEISLLDLLTVVIRRKRMICWITIAFALISCVVALLLPNRYTAVSSILPPQANQSLSSALLSQVAGAGALAAISGKDFGLKNPSDLYVSMLQSRTVQDAVIAHFDLMRVYKKRRMSDTRKKLESYCAVKASKDGMIHISVEDKDPKRASEMANYYVEQLQKLTSSLALTEAGQRRLFFDLQLEKAKSDLAGAEVAMQATQQKTGLILPESQSRVIIENVARVRALIATKEIQLQTMQTFATATNPQYVLMEQELHGLRAELAKLETQQNVGNGDLQIPTGKVPELGLEYVRRLRDVKYYESIFGFLAKELEVAKMDEARQGAVIQVVDKAIEPDKKSSPLRGLIILLATVVGFIVGTLFAFTADAWSKMRNTPGKHEQLEALRQMWSHKAEA